MNDVLRQNDTAFYVFDTQKLKNRIDYLRKHLPSYVSLCYAVKANTFLIGELKDCVDRFEVCSPGEAEICKKLNIDESKMVISGIYKTPKVIDLMVSMSDNDCVYTVESLSQFELFCTLAKKYNRTLKLLLRLTNDSQFGINEEEIENIIALRKKHEQIHILGIQFFSGTQKTSIKKLKREVEKLDAFLTKLKDSYDFDSEELEYGPGFPVAYFEGEEVDEKELFYGFSELLSSMVNKPKITLELGRSIAASCGFYYTHVVDIKRNKGQNYIIVDGGMHHIVYYGQHMAMKKPIFSVCDKENEPCVDSFTICGSLCSMNDIIAKQVPLPDVQIGDTLCFENTGAYCMTEGISLFLSRDIPAVYIKREKGSISCVRGSFDTAALNLPMYEKEQ